MTDEPTAPTTCCQYRRKIVIGVLAVLPERVCGVADSELADLLVLGADSPGGKPILAVRFCPWCGEPRKPGAETAITEPMAAAMLGAAEEGFVGPVSYAKCDACFQPFEHPEEIDPICPKCEMVVCLECPCKCEEE